MSDVFPGSAEETSSRGDAAPAWPPVPMRTVLPPDPDAEFPWAEELRLVLQGTILYVLNERSDKTLSDIQLDVLAYLIVHGPESPSRLAAVERVTPPSMNRMINALQARGLVVRERDAVDARRVDVRVTPAGRAVIIATKHVRNTWFVERLRKLSPEDRQALVDLMPVLQRLRDAE